jgi:hypothetical protein
VRSAFALEAVIVDHHGLPTLMVAETEAVHGGGRREHEPRGSRARHRAQAAAAALVAGVLSGLPVRELLRRATNQALAFPEAPAGGCAAAASPGCGERPRLPAAGERSRHVTSHDSVARPVRDRLEAAGSARHSVSGRATRQNPET